MPPDMPHSCQHKYNSGEGGGGASEIQVPCKNECHHTRSTVHLVAVEVNVVAGAFVNGIVRTAPLFVTL